MATIHRSRTTCPLALSIQASVVVVPEGEYNSSKNWREGSVGEVR